jgi:hypothetical protein
VPPDVVLPDAPLLLPLNRCQPPALDDDVELAADPLVDPDDGPRLIADVLPEDDVDDDGGPTRCHPLLPPAVEPALRVADEFVEAVRDAAGLLMLLAARVMAWRC